MKKTMNMIETLMEIQAKNAVHPDGNISFGGNTALSVLRQVKESLEDEIVSCGHCLSFLDMDELIRQGTITSDEAEKEETVGNAGRCILDRCVKYVRADDFCSFGIRDTGEEVEG